MPNLRLRSFLAGARGRLSKKLLNHAMKRRYRGPLALKIFFLLFSILEWRRYQPGHKNALHHYIPRFLLRRFSTPSSGGGLIIKYERGMPWRPVSIKGRAACEMNFYTFTEKGTKRPSSSIENQMFSELIENYGSRVVSMILAENRIDLTYLEESILAILVGAQLVRTPLFFQHIQKVLSFLHEKRGVPLDQMTDSQFYKKAFVDNDFKISLPEYLAFVSSHHNELTGDGLKNLQLALFAQLSTVFQERVFRLYPSLIHVPETTPLFLPDSGAIAINSNAGINIGPFAWLLNSNAIVLMPLSPTTCLYYSARKDRAEPPPEIIREMLLGGVFKSAYCKQPIPDIDSHLAGS